MSTEPRITYLDEHVDAIPELAQWHHAEWFEVPPNLSVADRIAGFSERARRGSIPTGLVAVIDSRVVGMVCLVACDVPSHCHLTPWLATVLVAPTHRHQGIGTALSRRAADEARSLGCRPCTCSRLTSKASIFDLVGRHSMRPTVRAVAVRS